MKNLYLAIIVVLTLLLIFGKKEKTIVVYEYNQHKEDSLYQVWRDSTHIRIAFKHWYLSNSNN